MRLIALLAGLILPGVASAQRPWCENADIVHATVEGDTLHIEHLSALINCCPEPVTWIITVGDASLFVEEHSQSPCDCECCFDVSVTLTNVPPGPWQLVYRWFDLEIGDWTQQIVPIVVPDVGQPMIPVIAAQTIDGCLKATAAPLPPPVSSWGRIKTLYR